MKKFIFALLITNIASAQSINLLKDINPGAQPSTPNYFAKFDGKLYFNANHVDYGAELWRTDGTSSGTVMVSDIIPGTASSLPTSLMSYDNKLFFKTLGTTSGLYSYDESNGVQLVISGMGSALNLTQMNGKIFFRRNNKLCYFYQNTITEITTNAYVTGQMGAVNGKVVTGANTDPNSNNVQLYVYDGNTVSLLKTINTSLSANPQSFYYFSTTNKLFFTASSDTAGFELWQTDGTTEGTTLLKDISPGKSSSFPGNFKQVGNKLFFTANDGTHGTELWVTDGTESGTSFVKDINPGSTGSNPNNLTELNGKLYFLAADGSGEARLWESDGTAEGTKITLELKPGYTNFILGTMEAYNGSLYLSAKLNVANGQELYKIDLPDLGLSESKKNNISIYPNPTTGDLFFTELKNARYDLYDSSGKMVKKDAVISNGTARLNVPRGNYIMVTKNEKGLSTSTKIIVK